MEWKVKIKRVLWKRGMELEWKRMMGVKMARGKIWKEEEVNWGYESVIYDYGGLW